MSSLKERIELLEADLKAVPSRISVYHDLPFAILRYDPTDEWELRRESKLLATRLDGEPMSVAHYGPTRIVYPTAGYDLDPTVYDPRWIWQLSSIDVA